MNFPRTVIENLSVSRLIVGTNWFLGYSHTSKAKNNLIKQMQTRDRLAKIIEVFLNAGVDTIYGVRPDAPHLDKAITIAEDRTGREAIRIGIPSLDLGESPACEDENKRILDSYAAIGCRICMPHQVTTDALVNLRLKRIAGVEKYIAMIRQRGMIAGLSTHIPETIPYADEAELDIGTYIQIYNALGFLMHVEVDWVHRIIWNASKPVITIKPLAAGRLLPLVGLAFVWATIRDKDMVCIGCLTPDEARECIDISLSQLERSKPKVELQKSRSKGSVI
jgi:hypothetical protein